MWSWRKTPWHGNYYSVYPSCYSACKQLTEHKPDELAHFAKCALGLRCGYDRKHSRGCIFIEPAVSWWHTSLCGSSRAKSNVKKAPAYFVIVWKKSTRNHDALLFICVICVHVQLWGWGQVLLPPAFSSWYTQLGRRAVRPVRPHRAFPCGALAHTLHWHVTPALSSLTLCVLSPWTCILVRALTSCASWPTILLKVPH